MFDLAIVGAGPAGMAAATLASELGLTTVLLDEQPGPGGQIYRNVEHAPAGSPLGADYVPGRALAASLRASKAAYRPATTVWHIAADGDDGAVVSVLADGRSDTVAARYVLLATGAIERPVPIPGWTLPGVMTAGAAQVLLKTADLVPDGRTVVAGQGPLLYLVALQLARAGAPPAAVLETTPHSNYHAGTRHLVAGLVGWRDLAKGLRLLFDLRRAGVPIRRRVRGLRATGRDRLQSVAWDAGEMAADYLLLHEGVIPNTQISLGLQLQHRWDEAQLCWHPVVDDWGRASIPNIWIAGDGAGILGAEAAALSGRLAALGIAAAVGHIDTDERDRRAAPIRVHLRRRAAIRPLLDALYRPGPGLIDPADEVIVCRCEEVTALQIRHAVHLGATGPNQVKAFTRCGMGPCQGRMCGPVVAGVIAAARGVPIDTVGTYRPRAPYKPITVGALAALGDDDGAKTAL
jgi:NADPH-dependent 2,4-dienoyl-CoA reductase/sulfur reductase-like enzyme